MCTRSAPGAMARPCALNFSFSPGSTGPGQAPYLLLSKRSRGVAAGNTCVVEYVRVLTRWTPPRMYPEATTQSDRGTGTRSSGLGTPQMNLTFPSGSQPPGWIVPTGSTAKERNNRAGNSVRDVIYDSGSKRDQRAPTATVVNCPPSSASPIIRPT